MARAAAPPLLQPLYKMLYKEATRSRQSPLQKAIGRGESVARFVGTAKSIYDAGKVVVGAVQAAAPYVSAAASLL